jgi:hypothetical protein
MAEDKNEWKEIEDSIIPVIDRVLEFHMIVVADLIKHTLFDRNHGPISEHWIARCRHWRFQHDFGVSEYLARQERALRRFAGGPDLRVW